MLNIRNPHQTEFPFSNKVAERIAKGTAGINASSAYVENHLRSRLLRQEAWVEDTATGEYQCTLERFRLVIGSEKQFANAAKRILGGSAYGTDRTHDDEVKVVFAHEAGKAATVTVSISSHMYRELVSQNMFSTSTTPQVYSP
jgi:hypothetical protein